MFVAYPAVFLKEEDGYSVIFPDLNYLATEGNSLNDALEMAVDCLAGYIYTCKEEEIPIPSDIKDIDPKKVAEALEVDCGESFVTIVSVNVSEYAKLHFNQSVKKTLTIPQWLNKEAMAKGINFSQVLQEALIEKLKLK